MTALLLGDSSDEGLEGSEVGSVFGVPDPNRSDPVDAGGPSDGADVGSGLEPANEVVQGHHSGDSESDSSHGQDKSVSGTSVASDAVANETKSEVGQLLADFLQREIGRYGSARSWAIANGLAQHQINRALAQKHQVQIDTLQDIADALQIEPWQVIYPGFDRRDSNVLQTLSAEAIDAAKMLDSLPDEGQRRFAFAALTNAIELLRAGPSGSQGGPKQPVPPPKPEPPKRS